MGLLGSFFFKPRKGGVVRRGSYVADVQWNRAEELRADRLGPSVDDIKESDESQDDPWRPKRHLDN